VAIPQDGNRHFFFVKPLQRPTLRVRIRMARQRQTLADQVVLGLITGGFLGPGLVIEGRDSAGIRFATLGGLLSWASSRGEILFESDPSGEIWVDCQVWCWGLLWRRLFQGIFFGVCFGAVSWRVLGGSLAWAIGVSGIVALSLCGVFLWRDRLRLRRQILAFLRNTTYLKAM
jgi:hypothetical protein